MSSKTWDEMEVTTHESGRLMFRTSLRRRNSTGEVETTPVRVCIPDPKDHIRARTMARIWFAEQGKLDADRDADIFEEMESICVLALCIRTDKEPHSQFAVPEELASWPEAALKEIKERIHSIEQLVDPREEIVSEEKFWTVVLEVATKANLLPLADIVGHEQLSCIVRMAREACLSPTAPSFARLPESSTPEP